MKVKSLIMQPYKVAAILGMAVRFQGEDSSTVDVFFTPTLVAFLKSQFLEIDRRFNVDTDAKFQGRIDEFISTRDRIGTPVIEATGVIQDMGVIETHVPIVLTTVNTAGLTRAFELDEVAVHGFVAELADNDLAFVGVQGQG